MVAPLVLILLLAACATPRPGTAPSPRSGPAYDYPAAPAAPAGPLDAPVVAALDQLAGTTASFGSVDGAALDVLAETGDPRLGWFVSDLLRFTTDLALHERWRCCSQSSSAPCANSQSRG